MDGARIGRAANRLRGHPAAPPMSHDLRVLDALANQPGLSPTPPDRAALAAAATAFRGAQHVVIRTGGKAGRIGESVVASAVVYGILMALKRTRRRPPHVTLVVDDCVRDLFLPGQLRSRFLLDVEVVPAAPAHSEAVAHAAALDGFEEDVLLLDLNGGSDGAPFLRVEGCRRGPHAPWRTLRTVERLFRTAVIGYAVRGPERRYADFVETLFSLPRYTLDGYEAQPAVLLSEDERAQAVPMLRRLGVAPGAIPFLCFFQSVAVAKCYDSWWDVMAGAAEAAASRGRNVAFLVASGPNQSGRPELEGDALAELFGGFMAPSGNASVTLCEIPSLRDIAILATRCVTLANDTGPGHVAAAAGSPVVTPYLPGEVYPRRVWASTPRHRGVTVEPSPFTAEEVRRAVLWGENRLMSAIPPQALIDETLEVVRLRYGV